MHGIYDCNIIKYLKSRLWLFYTKIQNILCQVEVLDLSINAVSLHQIMFSYLYLLMSADIHTLVPDGDVRDRI